ncbi:MAG: hypothetical protein FWG87_06515 [Defluviitaleaceae bacterium]|nr:hypothetical protein [Defluviitaleaceae bacterium]
MSKYLIFLNVVFIILCGITLLLGSSEFFALAYIIVYIIVVVRTLMTPGRRKTRRYLNLAYTAILVVQLTMLNSIVLSNVEHLHMHEDILRRVVGIVFIFMPMLVNRHVASVRYTHYYIPPVGETAAVGISELMNTASGLKRATGFINESRQKLSIDNLVSLAHDMTRHDSFHYVNSRSLTDEYFQLARASLDDPNIYIIISKTGSPASEFISVFTRKQYNHASISFDKALKTTISYNGGEKVYPPGLNMEILEFFRKSPDSKIMVYSLPCTAEQKKQMLDRIAKINREGSAYNILGLLMSNRLHKPNIMYCSQFVYNMLDDVGLAYFEKAGGKISPTDLVELDYFRRLRFELEITFA